MSLRNTRVRSISFFFTNMHLGTHLIRQFNIHRDCDWKVIQVSRFLTTTLPEQISWAFTVRKSPGNVSLFFNINSTRK